MTDLKLDDTGDLAIEDAGFVIVTDDDALVQHLLIRFRFFKSEWIGDLRVGITYLEDFLIKNPDLAVVRGIFREVILTTPGIDTLDAFELTFDTAIRKLSVVFTARKLDGAILEFDKAFIIGRSGFQETV